MKLISPDELLLRVPLTPSENEVRHWLRQSQWLFRRHKEAQVVAVRAGARMALGPSWPVPWAHRVEIRVVRCGPKQLDATNLRAGCKETEDACVKIGLFPDDGPQYVSWLEPEQRSPKRWGELPGPATYLFIRRVA